ncbi:MAG TPA: STAS domain-containing protein [Micromonosporaceae bacterium]|jgi:anti-anti-sigma regulatory factor
MAQIQVNTSESGPSQVTVLVRGAVDSAAGDDLCGVLVDVIMRRRPERFLIDLDGVTALDSAALGLLHAARATAEDVNLPVAFHTVGSPIRHQLDHDGIHDDGCRTR